MTGWGQSFWGSGIWGGDGVLGSLDIPALGDALIIVLRYPYSRQVEVVEDTQIVIGIFDANFNLDTCCTTIKIDDVIAYNGMTGFASPYIGRVCYLAGESRITLIRRTGFSYGQRVKVNVYATDATANVVEDTWFFTVRNDPTCYTGLAPLPLETALINPFEQFIGLEPLRQFMFDNVLREQTEQSANKAARTLYQLAYSTELSTIQNTYGAVDATALTTKVCEKQPPIGIDRALEKKRELVVSGINVLKTSGALNEAYSQIFHDYLDSSLYLYRVSLVANMLLFAKNYELAAGL